MHKYKAKIVKTTCFLLVLLAVSCTAIERKRPYSIEEKVQSRNADFEKCINNDKVYSGHLGFEWKIDSEGKPKEIKVIKNEVKDKELTQCFKSVLEGITFSTFGLYYQAKVKSYTFVFSNFKTKGKKKQRSAAAKQPKS